MKRPSSLKLPPGVGCLYAKNDVVKHTWEDGKMYLGKVRCPILLRRHMPDCVSLLCIHRSRRSNPKGGVTEYMYACRSRPASTGAYHTHCGSPDQSHQQQQEPQKERAKATAAKRAHAAAKVMTIHKTSNTSGSNVVPHRSTNEA